VERPDASGPETEMRRMQTTRHRLAEAVARLERLDAERERRGDSRFGQTTENRIIWGELIELELQEIDEQVGRICNSSGRIVQAATQSNGHAEVLMNAATHEPLNLTNEERAVLTELVESERARLLVEITPIIAPFAMNSVIG
jgi:hypothetical protein